MFDTLNNQEIPKNIVDLSKAVRLLQEKQELSFKHIEAGVMTGRRIFSGESNQGLEV